MNKNNKLRSQVIRLAHANPKLRKDLLPLVTTKTSSASWAAPDAIEVDGVKNLRGVVESTLQDDQLLGWADLSVTKAEVVGDEIQFSGTISGSIPVLTHWTNRVSVKDFYLDVMKRWHGGTSPGDQGDLSTLIRDSKWKSSGVGSLLDSANMGEDYRGLGGGNVLNAPSQGSIEGPVFSIWFSNINYNPKYLELDDLSLSNLKGMINRAKSPEEMMAMLKKRPAKEFKDGDLGIQGIKSKVLPLMAKKITKNWKVLKVLARSIDSLAWWDNGGNKVLKAKIDLRKTPKRYEEAVAHMLKWLEQCEKATLAKLKKTVK